MTSKRSVRRPASSAKATAANKRDEKAISKLDEKPPPSDSEQTITTSQGEQTSPFILPSPVITDSTNNNTDTTDNTTTNTTTTAPQLSKRALKRMRGWEPVIKPPENADALPAPAAPTADVVWLDNSRSVTLIPNSNSGVHTRRGAANLAALSPPTSYLVYTRDPLIKMGRAGRQNVHVITSLPPGGDPRNLLRDVPSVSSCTQRSTGTGGGGSNNASSSSRRRDDDMKCDDESEAPDDNNDEEEEQEEEHDVEQTEAGDDNNKNNDAGEEKESSSATTQSRAQRKVDADLEKTKKSSTTKRSGDPQHQQNNQHQQQQQQQRTGGLSAAQAMLPPPYRRNRRLKRKMHITEETPVFAVHSELRDTMPQIFQKAPFSTEEDVLGSTFDWREDPVLLYTRLLWEFAPEKFLSRVLQGRRNTKTTPIEEEEEESESE
ncbi:hypothetical protein LSM04_007243 [Trypanosoma melophagium]|uniref:uncharacterized protein n=1 Tax=Trypanosoma melophagium TaxID=715481 RepID=UPI00351A3457|nr:hypothetical protein LSM04_007243 [Trypanosoma melophagium]